MAESASRQLAGFLDRFAPEVAARGRAALARLRRQLPGAFQLVYDNYNALAIGFGPTERASEALVSIALYPRWVTLFFLRGAGLADPHGLLKGSGRRVRSIVLHDPATLDSPPVRDLIARAVKGSLPPQGTRGRLIIKAVSAKQRPRRPGAR
jgi:hypothetical protein